MRVVETMARVRANGEALYALTAKLLAAQGIYATATAMAHQDKQTQLLLVEHA
jgi:hypothetical protein